MGGNTMIGDIIVVVVCMGLIFLFREIDKQNNSLAKVKKFSDKAITDIGEYLKSQSTNLKNSSIELDVKQAQAVAAVKRLEESAQEFNKKNAELTQKIALVNELENRLNTYDSSLKDLFDMTERVEENLEKVRKHSTLVSKIAQKVESYENQISKIEKTIPAIVEDLRVQNDEKIHIIGMDFQSWINERSSDLQTLANHSVEKNESLLAEINQIYNATLANTETNAKKEAQQLYEKLRAEVTENSKELFETLQNQLENKAISQKQYFEQELSDKLDLISNNQEELIEEKIRERQTSFSESLEKLTSDFTVNLSNTNDLLDTNLASVESNLENKILKMKETMQNSILKQESEIAHQEQNLADLMQKSIDAEDKITNTYTVFENNLQQLANKTKTKIEKQDEEVVQLENNFEKLQKLINEMDSAVIEKQKSTEQSIEGIQDFIDKKVQEFNVQLEQRNTILRENLAKNTADLKNEIKELQNRVVKENNQKSIEFFASLEDQINSAKDDVEYKLQKINTVVNDVDKLEENLRRLMQVAEQNVYKDFDKFQEITQEKQANFETETNDAYNAIRTMLDTIDTELTELKTIASQNVSEKLNLFENDFYTNLKKRENTIADELLDWKQGFDEKLTQLNLNLETEKHSIESTFNDDMKTNLLTLQQNFKDQIAKIEDNFIKAEQEYDSHAKNIDATMHNFIDSQQKEIENARIIANKQFANDYETYRTSSEEKLKRFEREIENNIVQIEQSVGSVQEETSAQLDGLRANIQTWRERLDVQFQENKDLYGEKFESLQKNADERLAQIGQIFEADVLNFVNLSKEEMAGITSDIDLLKIETKKSIAHYDSRSEEMVEEFKKSYEEMLLETQKRINDETSESEKKLRDLRNLVQEVTQNSEDMQQGIVLKIQTEANQLQMNVDNIDSQLQHFVAQTNLIDKAEIMRSELETQMSELRLQLNKFENFRQVTDRIEGQLAKIRNLDDETISRMEKLDADRAKLNTLESDFNELILLSNSMDQKIAELKTNSDDLQLLQVNVKRYRENLEAVSARYERFEKKNEVLDQTIKDVDHLFEALRELENRLEACKKETSLIPQEVASVRTDISEVLTNSQSVNEVVDRLNQLDTKLADVTIHVENVQKARDMMIKIETRLAEITKDAKDQINLYKTVKTGGKREPGAPPIAVRENVIKLARQGWTSEQIADNLKLARGEVELILDFHNGDIH